MAHPFWYLRRRPSTVASEVDEELGVHLEMRVAELEAGGLPPHEARREAIRQFGDLSSRDRIAASRIKGRRTVWGER